ncbi:unnamed protein product [Symbiodinium natans]|uniref:Pentatricopeptide repeat-containing protein, chloroplastic n=1 Tax=Symbiodinium natans TaxID=878477 RepID=A0A812M064_9DINO|nr:unnamed protein product [Symbiodinium natans]
MVGTGLPAWDPAAFTNVLAAAGRARRWQQGLAALQLANREGRTNVIHFNVILRSCQQAEVWEAGLSLLGSLPTTRIDSDELTWTAVITSLKADWRRSSHLLQVAVRRQTVDTVTFSAAASGFESGGLWPRSMALLSDARIRRGLLDAVLVGTAASACDKGGAWAQSLALLIRASAGHVRLSDVCFSASTSASCRSGQWDVALGLLLDSVWKGFQTSVIILNSAESGVAKVGSWLRALSLLRTFSSCRLEPDTVSHNACLTSLKLRARWEKASALLSAMGQSAVPAGDVSVNAALAVLGEAGRWPLALTLLQHPQAMLSTDGIRLRESLSICKQASFWDLALDLLKWQATARLQPSAAGICSVARACERARRWQQSLRVSHYLVADGQRILTTAQVAVLSAEELVQSVWLGAQQLRWDDDWLPVSEALASKLGELPLEDLATALWSFGSLAAATPRFLQAAANEAVWRLQGGASASPRTLADLAWGFATLGFPAPQLMELLQQRLVRWGAEDYAGSNISNSERTQFISKAQVVVWASHRMSSLHEATFLHLQAVFGSEALSLSAWLRARV